MRIAPKSLLPLLLIAASLAGAGYLRATKPEVAPQAETERVWIVRAAEVERRDHQPTLQLYGELVAGREAVIRPKVAGEVVETSPKLREGGRFERGEAMLRIDSFDYRTALDELEAELDEAKARRAELLANQAAERMTLELDREQLSLVRRDVERFERLSGSSAASEKALDDAKIALSRQTGVVEQRQQAIVALDARLAQQAAAIDRLETAIKRAERDLADTIIEAPFGGVVAEVDGQIGVQLSTNDAIARLIDDQSLEIRFQLADADFGRLWRSGLLGRKVVGRWRLGDVAFELPATVERVAPRIDPTSGGAIVYASLDDGLGGAPLRPGAFIEVEMPDRLYEDVVELPASALFGGDTVYVIEEDRLKAANVELVAARGERVLVLSDLPEGTAVVASRLAEIEPGLKVKVAE